MTPIESAAMDLLDMVERTMPEATDALRALNALAYGAPAPRDRVSAFQAEYQRRLRAVVGRHRGVTVPEDARVEVTVDAYFGGREDDFPEVEIKLRAITPAGIVVASRDYSGAVGAYSDFMADLLTDACKHCQRPIRPIDDGRWADDTRDPFYCPHAINFRHAPEEN
jgi:hypothetical protein